MKSLRLFVLSALVGAMATTAGACDMTPQEAQNAKNAVFSAAQIACIIANAETDEQSILTTCNVVNALLPDLRAVVGAQRDSARRYAAAHPGMCAHSDAGR